MPGTTALGDVNAWDFRFAANLSYTARVFHNGSNSCNSNKPCHIIVSVLMFALP